MKYLKTYEGIIKYSESSSIPVNDEITKIVNDCLNTLKIYQKENMQTIVKYELPEELVRDHNPEQLVEDPEFNISIALEKFTS